MPSLDWIARREGRNRPAALRRKCERATVGASIAECDRAGGRSR